MESAVVTPRTNAATRKGCGLMVDPKFAQSLERELIAALKESEALKRDEERLDWLDTHLDWRDKQNIFNVLDGSLPVRGLIDSAIATSLCQKP